MIGLFVTFVGFVGFVRFEIAPVGMAAVNVLVQLTRLVAMLRISTNLELRYGKELQGKGGD